jgi:hypothetical protein
MCAYLGILYFFGSEMKNPPIPLVVQQNYVLAEKYLGDGCRLGDRASCGLLGELFVTGKGSQRNVEFGLELLLKTCEAGIKEHCRLGILTIAKAAEDAKLDRIDAVDDVKLLQFERMTATLCSLGDPDGCSINKRVFGMREPSTATPATGVGGFRFEMDVATARAVCRKLKGRWLDDPGSGYCFGINVDTITYDCLFKPLCDGKLCNITLTKRFPYSKMAQAKYLYHRLNESAAHRSGPAYTRQYPCHFETRTSSMTYRVLYKASWLWSTGHNILNMLHVEGTDTKDILVSSSFSSPAYMLH